MEAQPKDARLDFRLTSSQKITIEAAAELRGVTVTDFVKNAVMQAAIQAIGESKPFVRLSEEDWNIFIEAMSSDKPSPPAKAMERAVARYNEGHANGDSYTW